MARTACAISALPYFVAQTDKGFLGSFPPDLEAGVVSFFVPFLTTVLHEALLVDVMPTCTGRSVNVVPASESTK